MLLNYSTQLTSFLFSLIINTLLISVSPLNCSYQPSPYTYATNIILYDDASIFLSNSQIHTF